MSTIAGKRQRSRAQTSHHPSKRRRIKRQTEYHSSSSEDDDAESEDERGEEEAASANQSSLAEAEDDEPLGTLNAETEDTLRSEDEENDSEGTSISGDDSDEDGLANDNPNTTKVRRKRNDPAAFANSMSKILNTKLTVAKRADPVLSRSKDAAAAGRETQDAKLEAKARQQIREEKKAKLETGHVKDILGLQNPDVSTEAIMAREKKYKKLAQQGVIRLFNAVLAAQLKGQEASRSAKEEGVVGIGKRDEKVNEMSKQGFLDLIAGGGKK